MTMRRTWASVVGIVALLLLSACQRASEHGPLVDDDVQGGHCVRARGHSSFVLADDALQNRGQHPVTLDSVSLEDPHNLVLTEARVTPVYRPGPRGFMGVVPAEPAHFRGTQRSAWEASQEATHAVIDPEGRNDMMLLAVASLRDDHSTGSTGLEVTYHDADGSYVWHDHVTFQILVDSRCRT